MPTKSPTSGVLVDHQLNRLIQNGSISSFEHDRIQPASIDLCIGSAVWEVAGVPAMGAAKGFHFKNFIDQFSRNRFSLARQTATLSPGSVYIAELTGDFTLPNTIYGYANPKSSTGRIDVHCTLVAEGAQAYNTVPHGYHGKIYVLIVPQSFPIILNQGDALLQLRLFKGHRQFLSTAEMDTVQKTHAIITCKNPEFTDQGAVLRLNLHGNPGNLVAQVIGRPIHLRGHKENPRVYFTEKPLYEDTLFLEPDQFLLATTVERVRVPSHLCAEMIAFREEYGELRTHYAGFFDPGFGYGSTGEIADSGVVCEIRNIGKAPIILAHGQPICLLRYEHVTATPEKVYGHSALSIQSNYQGQEGIKLAKYFTAWEA